ncbi:MAG: 2OG-Fe(II) oxygenase [Sandaracinaceae bacterium]|nr:2OG-Fe(II) oxygenase [Sandaracinaceae bacterium]
MIVREPYWVFPAALDKRDCDGIVELGLLSPRERGQGRDDALEAQRRSEVAWITDDWVYERLQPWLARANDEAGWHFELEIVEDLQFAIYGEGGRYDWHVDSSPRPYTAKDARMGEAFEGLIRKVSFSVQLSDPSTYEGGDLELEVGLPGDPERSEVPEDARARGTVIVFPSFVPHRVRPVARGVRYSLVGWACGKPWR